jgi:hypothetical protein
MFAGSSRTILAAAFVAATLVGSRLPEPIDWPGQTVAHGRTAGECYPSTGSGEDAPRPACEAATALA